MRAALITTLATVFVTTLFGQSAMATELTFRTTRLDPDCRIGAIAYLGEGVVIAGTRGKRPGYIYKSTDYGETWNVAGDITGTDVITCVCSGGHGVGYLLTGRNVHVWKTTDYGDTWKDLGRISTASNPGFANAYGILVTKQNTILVSDADINGGHIHRSTDGGATWQNLGQISTHALYRMNVVDNGIIANGWAGRIYKSTDDGATW